LVTWPGCTSSSLADATAAAAAVCIENVGCCTTSIQHAIPLLVTWPGRRGSSLAAAAAVATVCHTANAALKHVVAAQKTYSRAIQHTSAGDLAWL
jgi:hypothetical protein